MSDFTASTISLVAYGNAYATTYPQSVGTYNAQIFNLSGIELNQSKSSNYVAGTTGATQEFQFTSDYLRAGKYAPAITGFQFYLNVNHTAVVNQIPQISYWISKYDTATSRWVNVTSGVQDIPKLSSAAVVDQWITIKPNLIEIDAAEYDQKFRIQIIGNSYIQKIYYQTPNPLTNGKTLQIDGINLINGNTSSLTFRVLTASADSGTDFLTNKYRAGVFKSDVSNVLSRDAVAIWMSKPNPSKFAVESLYFDLSVENQPVIIDSILLDPVTPGMYFNVYYSNDDNPGIDDETWETLMWTRVPKVFQATKKQSYILPDAIAAKYVKIEFSRLQGKYYAPGDFEKPVLYKKFPQWVFDYFIAEYQYKRNKTYDPFVSGSISLEYDLLNLAFNYYKGDIIDGVEITPNLTNDLQANNGLVNLLNSNDEESMQTYSLDINTLQKIKIAFSQFSAHPATVANTSSTVGTLATQNAYSTLGAGLSNGRIAPAQNYSTEIQSLAIADTTQVSTFEREALLFEKSISPMFFYVTCRHGYREAWAKFENDKAYFAGIKEIAFQKSIHSSKADDEIYTFIVGENSINLEHNDFVISADKKSWLAK